MEASYGQTDYEAAEKTFHFCRRKRWIRQRKIDTNSRVSGDLLVIKLLFCCKIWCVLQRYLAAFKKDGLSSKCVEQKMRSGDRYELQTCLN